METKHYNIKSLTRNLFFLIYSLYSINQSHAQFNTYEFTKLIQPYHNLINGKNILSDTFWYSKSYPLNSLLGEPEIQPLLLYYNDTFEYWNLDLKTGTLVLYNRKLDNSLDVATCACRLRESNQIPPYKSEINYKYDSIVQAHQFEFKDIGLIDTLENLVGNLNMQIWFYQNRIIEYHFGNCLFNESMLTRKKFFNFGTQYWKKKDTTANVYFNLLTGNPNQPIYLNVAEPAYRERVNTDQVHINGFPDSGTVYRLSVPLLGIGDFSIQRGNYISPNPFGTELNFSINTSNFKQMVVTNSMGKQIYCGIPLNKLHTGQWQPGIYFVSLTNLDDKISYQKVIKAEN